MSDIGGFEFEVLGLDEELKVRAFSGREAMSELYCFELDLVSRSYKIDFDDVIDKAATLKLIDKQGNIRAINGVIASFEQGGTGHHFTQYKAVLMPSLHRLRYRSDNRIFQNKSVVEIMESVLKEAGIMEVEFVCKEQHEAREYCVQYRETDFEFVERLASEEGFHYSFEHSEGNHKLVFADTTLGNPTLDLGDIEFNANPGGRIEESYFKTFTWRKSVRTEHVTHRDYTFKYPDNNLEAAKGSGDYKKYDYPGRYKDYGVGNKFTEYQLEAERRDHAIGEITSDVVQLDSGSYFDFKGHRNDAYNKRYLITDIHHEGNQPQVLEEDAAMTQTGEGTESYYHNNIKVVEYGVNWRPIRCIRPKVDGPQIAKVVGPSGEEIYTDEFGRVKVQFPWDRYGKSDEHSSCWIRVSQNWAGGAWGHMAIPRIDQEVIVEFLEGDPDQPIITGRTYHSSNRPPYPLPQNKTRMTIKSKTHKGEGYNELRFEDEKDVEEVYIHAEKDMNTIVQNNKCTLVENYEIREVKADDLLFVRSCKSNNIEGTETTNIGYGKVLNIGSTQIPDQHTLAFDDLNNKLVKPLGSGDDKQLNLFSNGDVDAGSYVMNIYNSLHYNIGQSIHEAIGVNKDITTGKSFSVSANSNLSLSASMGVSVTAGKIIRIICGSSSIMMYENGDIFIEGNNINVSSSRFSVNSDDITLNGGQKIVLKSPNIKGN